MDTIVHPQWHPDASLDATAESIRAQPDEEEWLAADDAVEIEVALDLSAGKPKAPAGGWSRPFAAALLCHVLALAVLTKLSLRAASAARWGVVRGDPAAQDAPSKAGSFAREDTLAEKPVMAALPKSLPSADIREPAVDQALEDSSSLPDRLDLLTASPADAVIGIGVAGASQRLPRFASPRRPVAASSSGRAATQPAGGETTPPRVAGLRGQRDGFDSRGLPIPDYPTESQRRGEQGEVIVDVEVLQDGRVGAVHVASDAGYPRLGAAAAEKVKLATFEPARLNGRPVVGHIRIPYLFTLQ